MRARHQLCHSRAEDAAASALARFEDAVPPSAEDERSAGGSASRGSTPVGQPLAGVEEEDVASSSSREVPQVAPQDPPRRRVPFLSRAGRVMCVIGPFPSDSTRGGTARGTTGGGRPCPVPEAEDRVVAGDAALLPGAAAGGLRDEADELTRVDDQLRAVEATCRAPDAEVRPMAYRGFEEPEPPPPNSIGLHADPNTQVEFRQDWRVREARSPRST